MSARRRRGDLDRAAVFEAILGDLGAEAASPDAPPGTVAIDAIVFPERQPRQSMDPVALANLAASIRERGVLEPVLVRRVERGYELIAGERRTRAARDAGLTRIPAIVLDLDDREALEISIMENLQREDLNAVEETEAVLQLLELTMGLDRGGALALLGEVVQEARGREPQARFDAEQKRAAAELFERLGRFTPASFLANRVPILGFPDELLEVVRSGALDFTKAQALARLDDPGERRRLLEEAVREELSLSQIRRRITEIRSDRAIERPLDDVVLNRIHQARRLLQRRSLAKLPESRLRRVGDLLDELLSLLEPG